MTTTTTIQVGSLTPRPTVDHRPDKQAGKPASPGFAAMLAKEDPATGQEDNSAPPTLPSNGDEPLPTVLPAANDGLVPLGEISPATPSVSHLLSNHPTLRHECWDIIFAKINQGKQFTNMRPGMTVSLNPATQELTWTAGKSRPAAEPLDSIQSPLDFAPHSAKEGAPDDQLSLGTISADHPTLSHLLKNTPQFRDQAWDIIFSAANRNKPYAALPPGCLVTINPQTLELSFQERAGSSPGQATIAEQAEPEPAPTRPEFSDEQKSFSEKLAESVRSYLGRPYRALDCYGLVVQGLKNQGVRYSGSGGLRQQLERLAAQQGLPANAYQNGEGLIEVAGNKLYDASFVRINDVKQQSARVMEHLKPHLQAGMLLSFSTPTRGHTGVVAQKEGEWTYVNSGMIDNQVDGGRVARRVGEETLTKEIENWFALAKKKGTSLKVSAGLFDPQKLKNKGRMVANNRSDGKQDVI